VAKDRDPQFEPELRVLLEIVGKLLCIVGCPLGDNNQGVRLPTLIGITDALCHLLRIGLNLGMRTSSAPPAIPP